MKRADETQKQVELVGRSAVVRIRGRKRCYFLGNDKEGGTDSTKEQVKDMDGQQTRGMKAAIAEEGCEQDGRIATKLEQDDEAVNMNMNRRKEARPRHAAARIRRTQETTREGSSFFAMRSVRVR